MSNRKLMNLLSTTSITIKYKKNQSDVSIYYYC